LDADYDYKLTGEAIAKCKTMKRIIDQMKWYRGIGIKGPGDIGTI